MERFNIFHGQGPQRLACDRLDGRQRILHPMIEFIEQELEALFGVLLLGNVRDSCQTIEAPGLDRPLAAARVRGMDGSFRPSALSGNTISNGSPVATARVQPSITAGNALGSITTCHPQPTICSGVVPVYS